MVAMKTKITIQRKQHTESSLAKPWIALTVILILVVLVMTHAPVCASGAAANGKGLKKTKLVLQIVVDQLRGDLPLRYLDRFGNKGFRLLFEKGTHYDNAHFQHANTETLVGHSVLATGAFPSHHGMVANKWYDREKDSLAYIIEDSRYPVLNSVVRKPESAQINPSKRTERASSNGRSPKAILSSTISDEMVISSGGRSRAFAISVKDRGAIPLAGHAGKAFWYSKNNGRFVTTSYYYDTYPQWVEAWNAKGMADKYKGTSWNLLHDRNGYMFGSTDDRPYEGDVAGFGRTFPHSYGDGSSKHFYTLLTLSPAADELAVNFAKTLIEKEKLGQGDATDYLGISLSSPDYVGHIFGLSSVESEDNLLRVDKALADLLTFVDEKVGLKKTLIILTADHGAPEAPEYMASLGMETGRINPTKGAVKETVEKLQDELELERDLVKAYQHPYIYLDKEAIREKGLDSAEVAWELSTRLATVPGIAAAVPSGDMQQGGLPDTKVNRQIQRNFHPKRSGDIYLVPEQFWFVHAGTSIPLSAMHGSPWAYDTYVPIVFAGAGIPAQRISRRVHPVDIAPTIAAILGIKPPSGSVGDVLGEVVGSSPVVETDRAVAE
jgi:predicted AlkP superfamily pyrophosphatase or phosphodiesterase